MAALLITVSPFRLSFSFFSSKCCLLSQLGVSSSEEKKENEQGGVAALYTVGLRAHTGRLGPIGRLRLRNFQ